MGVGVIIGSWFTSSSIFIFLNLVIGTIFIRSRFAAPITQTLMISPQLLLPLPSSLLKRVKSFNFALGLHQPTHHPQTELETPCPKKNPQEPQLARTPSLFEEEEEPETKGSGSEEEDTEGRRQLREIEEEGVDAKADDFITMFKKQLRLQRVESNLSYEQMLQ